MSALAGLCYWNGSVNESALATLAVHGQASGQEGSGATRPAPGVVLQANVLRFDRWSARERQPYTLPDGSVLTWDGRLDNRSDLIVTLHRDLRGDYTDAALVAAAYARWGLESLPRLVGDWSLALWDNTRQAVLLARDYMGARPLHYHESPEGLAWATRLEVLTWAFGLHEQIDDAYIAARFAGTLRHTMTPFRNTHLLPAGHLLLASRTGGVSVRRFWRFRPATVRYRSTQEYTDQLRELLTEAVQVRLRAERSVWAQLSGGWDSSSVVCLAHALVQTGSVDAPRLRPISVVAGHAPESDVSPFIRPVEDWCRFETFRVAFPNDYTFAELLGQFTAPSSFSDAINEPIRAAGDQIVLTGLMGDSVMLRSPSAYPALLEPLHSGHPLRTLRLCYAHARYRERPFLRAVKGLARMTYGSDPRRNIVAARLPSARGLHPRLMGSIPPLWSPPELSVAEFPAPKRPLVKDLYASADSYALVDSGRQVAWTCPYTHRPLVEFILSVPWLAIWDPFVPRAAMKRALSDVLPPQLLARTTKSSAGSAAALTRRDWSARVAQERHLIGPAETWHLVKRSYVDRHALEAALEDLYAGTTTPGRFMTIALKMEAWLRTLTSTPQAEFAERPPTLSAAEARVAHK